MAKAKSLAEAVRELYDEPDLGQRLIYLDAFLFPDEYGRGLGLSAHQRLLDRKSVV